MCSSDLPQPEQQGQHGKRCDIGQKDQALLRRGRQLGLSVPFSEPVLGEIKPQGPAFSAGLRAGDRVLRVNEQPIVDAQSLKSLIRAYAVGVGDAPPMRWVVERQGQVTQVDVQPRIHREGNAPAVGRIDAFVGGLR